jgi:hypothetical protein
MSRKVEGTDPLETVIDKALVDPFRRAVARVVTSLKHDRDHFTLPAQDAHGHSEPILSRIQPGWARAISVLISTQAYPFRGPADFVRWAIWIAMHVLQELDTGTVTVDSQAAVMIRIVRERERLLEMHSTMKLAEKRMAELMLAGFEGEARKMLDELRTAIDDLPSGEAKAHYELEYRKRFGSMMGDAKAEKQMNFFFTVDKGGPV